jgi:hypothetical protein
MAVYVSGFPVGTWVTGSKSYVIAAGAIETAAGPTTISASAAQTLDNFTQSAAATVKVSAAASQTLANFAQTATGTLKLSASAAQTLADFTQSTAGIVKVSAAASQTLDNFTQVATEFLVGAPINASAAQTLAAFTQVATATLAAPLNAVANINLANFISIGRLALGTPPFIKTATKPEGYDSQLLTRVKEAFGPVITRPGPGWENFLMDVNPRAIDERIPPYKQLVSQTYRDIELTHDDDDNVVVIFKLGDGYDFPVTVPPDFPGFNKDYLAGLY